MKKQLLFMCLLAFLPVFLSCGDADVEDEDATLYTCSMHPQVVQEGPGNCPICGMELTPMGSGGGDSQAIMLNETEVLLANITTDTTGLRHMSEELLLTATVAENPLGNEEVSARIGGRIERLYVRDPGQIVKKGDHLFDLYSEQLLSVQTEYLLAKESAVKFPDSSSDFERIMKAAATKLLLWGMTEEQVRSLNNLNIRSVVPYYSPAGGTITDIMITEGSYVAEGSPVLRMVNLSSVWVEAQAYPGEAEYFRPGMEAEVIIPGGGEPVNGRVLYINPELAPGSRLNIVRLEVANPDGNIRPGMQAYVRLTSESDAVMTVPSDAVIREAGGSTVWVQKGALTFEPRMVHTGIETGGRTEIHTGLQRGDTVVVTGAYLLHSEYLLYHSEGDPHAGH